MPYRFDLYKFAIKPNYSDVEDAKSQLIEVAYDTKRASDPELPFIWTSTRNFWQQDLASESKRIYRDALDKEIALFVIYDFQDKYNFACAYALDISKENLVDVILNQGPIRKSDSFDLGKFRQEMQAIVDLVKYRQGINAIDEAKTPFRTDPIPVKDEAKEENEKPVVLVVDEIALDKLLLDSYKTFILYKAKLDAENSQTNPEFDQLETWNKKDALKILDTFFGEAKFGNPEILSKSISEKMNCIDSLKKTFEFPMKDLDTLRIRGRGTVLMIFLDTLWKLIDFVTNKKFDRVEGSKVTKKMDTLFKAVDSKLAGDEKVSEDTTVNPKKK